MVFKRFRPLTLLLLGLVLPACASAAGEPVAASTESLPPWQGDLQQLFDDSIDAAAVGMSVDGVAPETDRRLPLRARASELASRMRVQTVTRDSAGARVSYVVVLQVGKPALIPPRYQADEIEIEITPETPAFGIVRSLETSLRGRTFVGFIRRFAGAERPELHWHLSADTPAVAQIVHQFGVMEDLAGR